MPQFKNFNKIKIICADALDYINKDTIQEYNKSKESNEDTRLKYRYLDLRNKEVHDNIIFRSKIMDFLRKTMKEMDFLEVQTPIITATSPEGARDFIIPSRKHKGKFYALPQAPQQFKQLLMISGFQFFNSCTNSL